MSGPDYDIDTITTDSDGNEKGRDDLFFADHQTISLHTCSRHACALPINK